jgi:hypothetical protein
LKPSEKGNTESEGFRLKLLVGELASFVVGCWYMEDLEKDIVGRYALAGRSLYT